MIKTKIKHYITFQRMAAFLALLALVVISGMHLLAAQTVTEGYDTTEALQRGMLVSLNKKDATKIEPTTFDNIDNLHGVVVNANDAPVTLSRDGQKTFVASVGQFEVLVSDQNGPIGISNYITASSVSGIGMRADGNESMIIGKALVAFDGTKNVISTTTAKDTGGQTRSVHIGRILVDISVARNPLAAPDDNLPHFLRRVADSVADKHVSPLRVYLGMVIFVLSATVTGVMMYGAIRSAIISLGRNPLSRKSILRSMFQVVIVALIVLLIGLFGVYLILKL